MKIVTLTILNLLLTILSIAQNDLSNKNLYGNTYVPEAVIDEKYGIIRYEKLNMMLGGDTVRNNKSGYAANGYEEDYYTTGQLLHKGFYLEGQLKIYKNYFPNGNVERNFRLVDLKKSKMSIFYKDGTIKSEIVYIGNQALRWEDYYPNGTLEFVEEYDKDFQYYVFKANYYENANPEYTLEMTDKKKILYTESSYYPNGKLKEQGEVKYDVSMFDYKRVGTWRLFDENGNPNKEVKYASGNIVSEKNL